MSGAPAIPPRPRRPSGLQKEGATLQPPSGDTPPSASSAPSGSSPSNSRTVSPVRTRMPLSVAGQPVKAIATPSHTKRISFAMDAAAAGQGMIAPVEGEDAQSQLRSWTSKVAADNSETTEEGKDDYVFIPAEESKGTRSGRSSPAVGLTGRSSPATISQEERVARLHAIRTQGSRLDRWDEQLDKYPILHALELHTGIRKVYFALLAMIGTISLVFFGLGTSLVCILVGFLYPMYMSFKALEDRDRNMDMLKQWLMYWVVYGLFTVFEHYSDTALNWVPMYNPLKLIFLLWCFLPKYNGATTIFHAFVRPIIVRNEAHIQGKILEVKDVASETITHMGLNLKDKGVKLGHALRKKSMDMWQQQQLAMRQQAASLRTPRGRSSLSIPENPYEPEDMHQPGLQTPSSTRSVLGKKLE